MCIGMHCEDHPRASEKKISKASTQWLKIKARLYRALFEGIGFPRLAT
jgi:hypothetical protein